MLHQDDPRFVAATEQASEADRQFFAAHPKRKHRLRPPFPFEDPTEQSPSDGYHLMIVVRQVTPGVRVRSIVNVSEVVKDTEAQARKAWKFIAAGGDAGRTAP